MSLRMRLALALVCIMTPAAHGTVGFTLEPEHRWRALADLAYVSMSTIGFGDGSYDVLRTNDSAWSSLQSGGFWIGTLDGGAAGSSGYLDFFLDKCGERWTLRVRVIRWMDAPGDPSYQLSFTVWEERHELKSGHRKKHVTDGIRALIARFTDDWWRANPDGVRRDVHFNWTNQFELTVIQPDTRPCGLFSVPADLVFRGRVEYDSLRSTKELRLEETVYVNPRIRTYAREMGYLAGACVDGLTIGDHVLAFLVEDEDNLVVPRFATNCCLGLRLPRPGEAVAWDVADLLSAVRTGHAWKPAMASEAEARTMILLDRGVLDKLTRAAEH